MKTTFSRLGFAGLVGIILLGAPALQGAGRFPDPTRDSPRASAKDIQTAVLAGGCFWGIEAVFEQLNGVTDVVSGYAGGPEKLAHYQMVGSGQTGHAESVKITYDASQVTYGQLLKVFFSVAHDPTELNRQGPDEGPQYRSSVFVANDEQKQVATAYIAQLNDAKVFKKKIVTTVVPLEGFYAAEDYHQNYLKLHPTQPYIVYNDLPKLDALKAQLPELMKPELVKKKGGTK
jgi:peptide-methionine (S)-S-oxide reductase